MWVGGGTRGRKERRVGTKEGELKRGHPVSILLVDCADYAQRRIWMVKFLRCPGESGHRLKQAASGSRQGEAKQELISFL